MKQIVNIRPARPSDLTPIMEIVKKSIAILHAEHNPQWDDSYPTRAHFAGDLERQTLYVGEQLDSIVGFLCIDQEEPAEYQILDWSNPGACILLHRMAVAPESRGQRIGSSLLQFVEASARKYKIPTIKTDTYAYNFKMNTLFKRHGFVAKGEIALQGRPGIYCCYEKILVDFDEKGIPYGYPII